MKAHAFYRLIPALLLAGAISLGGCKKDKDDDDVSLAQDNANAEAIAGDASDMADQAARGAKSFKNGDASGILSACAMVTHDTISNPKKITIDFGPQNCLCNDGRNRRGKIIITYTGKYFDAGTQITFSFDEYYQNDNKVEGLRTVTNKGKNTAGHTYWDITSNLTITKANGGVHTWSSTRTREILQGEATPNVFADDIYSVTGSASGTGANGNSFSATVTSALYREMSCQWISKGALHITISGKADRDVDFGNGTCDNLAQITIRGKTFDYRMR